MMSRFQCCESAQCLTSEMLNWDRKTCKLCGKNCSACKSTALTGKFHQCNVCGRTLRRNTSYYRLPCKKSQIKTKTTLINKTYQADLIALINES